MTGRDPAHVRWGEFAAVVPPMAEFGHERLSAVPAYLATVRSNGAPRVHPVTPIFTDQGLYLFMEPSSPKGEDLRERGRFALHNGVPDNAGTGGEFWIGGTAVGVDGSEERAAVVRSATYTPADRHVLFELLLGEARCLGYGDVSLPSPTRWSVSSRK